MKRFSVTFIAPDGVDKYTICVMLNELIQNDGWSTMTGKFTGVNLVDNSNIMIIEGEDNEDTDDTDDFITELNRL